MHRIAAWLFAILHRLRARSGAVLSLGAVLVFALGPLAFRREMQARGASMRWDEAIYWTGGLFTFATSVVGYPQTFFLRVLYFAAPTISASAILGALFHVLAERGPLFGQRLRGHVVVGGLGHLGTAVARHLREHGDRVVAIEIDATSREVSEVRSAGDALIVVGDMTSAAVLERARCSRARSVFFTSPNDAVNLDAAFTVRRLVREKPPRHPPTIFAHVYDVALSEALRDRIRAHIPGEAPIIPFSSYRFAAKSLLARLLRDRLVPSLAISPGLALVRTQWPDDDHSLREADTSLQEGRRRLLAAFRLGAPSTTSPARYAIVGLGRFGRSVARELLDALPEHARFLVVERSTHAFEAGIEGFTEEERARFETFIGDATRPNALHRLAGFSANTVLVCTDNDISNLRLALELHRRDVDAIVRMFDLEAANELGRGLREGGITPLGLSRLFRAAIPILTHERRILAALHLDLEREARTEHLFYLARLAPSEREVLGDACVPLDALPRDEDAIAPPGDLAFVWHRAIGKMSG